MLLEFRVENHRSIRSEQAISLETGAGGSSTALPAMTVAAVYGANASGKSNLLSALAFMREAVVSSHRRWPPEGGVPREPFAWGDGEGLVSMFEVTLMLDGVKYLYGFVCDSERFSEEWLFAWPQGRKQTWFERDGDVFKFGDHLKGENKVTQKVTRENSLFLSAAAQNRHEQLAELYRWFSVARMPGRRNRIHFSSDWWLRSALAHEGGPQHSLFPDSDVASDLTLFRELLKAADVGIVDLKVVHEDEESFSSSGRRARSRVWLRHESAHGEAWLPIDQESDGTQTLFRLGPQLITALKFGALLLVDELEASLHPLLAQRVVELFNNPETNPSGAQLFFTTHDTNLLGTIPNDPVLRREQVWLTEKDSTGASCVYPLTDFKPRKSENLERGYLQGRYGAIPFLGSLLPSQEPA